MDWLELSVKVPDEFVEPVSYILGRYGRAFSVEDLGNGQVEIRGYLTSRAKRSRAKIEVGIKLIGALTPIEEMKIRELDKGEWEENWKRHFTIRRIGRRLVIRPSWIKHEARSGDLVLELDPGLAFGTGHHPTTEMCLVLLEEIIIPGMGILDLGTGSGILTIAALKLGAGYVTALDVDAIAIRVARKNLRTNGIKERVHLALGSLPCGKVEDGSLDLVVANISHKVINDSAIHLWESLKPGGRLILSGFLQTQEDKVLYCFSDLGLSLQDRRTLGDWSSLVFSRPD